MAGGGDAHQGEVTACRRAHDADLVRIQAAFLRFTADNADGALQILPGRGVLRQAAFGPWCPVLHRDDGYTHGVQVTAGRCDLETIGIIASITTAGIDDLDGVAIPDGRDVPLDIRRALALLRVGHLAFRPDVFPDAFRTVFIGSEAAHEFHFRLQRAQKAHLRHEFDAALQAEGTMRLVRVQMQLGRDAHPAELAVDERGAIG